VYRTHWWPAHDRQNRAFIAQLTTNLRSVAAPVAARLSVLLAAEWPARGARVDVVWVAKRQGAYTTYRPPPAHVIFPSADAKYSGWAAVEMLFHETAHVLAGPLRGKLADELRRSGKDAELWHVALFYLVGEVVRAELAGRGIPYTPYLEATGLLDRAWSRYRPALDVALGPYVAGGGPLDEAVRRFVAAVPGP
jgi:hypothetical protein